MDKWTNIEWYNSIKIRLIAMIAVISIVPIILFGLYNMEMLKKEIQKSIHQHHALAASRVSHTVTDLIVTLQTALDTVSLTNSEFFLSNNENKKEEFMYGVLKNFPHLEELIIISYQGQETAKVSKRYAYSDKDLNKVAEPQLLALQNGELYIDNAEVDNNNQVVFDCYVPISYLNREFAGGFIGKISLRKVMEEMSSLELPNGSYIMLVDREGNLIGHTDYSQVLRQQDVLGSESVQNLLKDSDASIYDNFKSITYKSYTGEEVLGVYGLIPTVGWGVVVEQPLSNAYSALWTMMFRLTIVLFIIIVIIIVLIAFIVSMVIRPVKELSKGVSSVQNGNLNYQIPYRSKDELGLVIEAFNIMINEIKIKRENEKVALIAEKRASVGLLASGVAHEINNPMNILGFYADDLLELMETKDVNELKTSGVFKDYLLNIREQIKRCTDIVQSLLTFSREVEPRIKNVYIPDVINIVLKLVKYPISKQNIELELSWDESVPCVLADESQMQQVILNLATNSLHAMPNGGKLTIKLYQNNDMVCIEIIDTGTGINEEDFKHIYDPFFTTKPLGNGTGLGLPIIQTIVERYGGYIYLKNNDEKGVKAKVCIPTSKR
ncbi:sensor histidine kinase [Sedimentibacter sp. MB31-C6]|uniref:sensor histidine kinase n=1 Tax=Sedimentibacter sp. MB31-C6 TaxID=3109366 RepID=UPI002DDC981F|nr:sensor histidine kinase [Sedimentibacter sp. MB36-C1]WSI04464.1 sensor histidine kinase [Sedimentibacter sp. MB36-C1]